MPKQTRLPKREEMSAWVDSQAEKFALRIPPETVARIVRAGAEAAHQAKIEYLGCGL